jgi:hypothetical protein
MKRGEDVRLPLFSNRYRRRRGRVDVDEASRGWRLAIENPVATSRHSPSDGAVTAERRRAVHPTAARRRAHAEPVARDSPERDIGSRPQDYARARSFDQSTTGTTIGAMRYST